MCGGIVIVAHSGATSGHSATCEASNDPNAALKLTRQRPGSTIVVVPAPPERLGFAQAGQA
jgi:hypothetical protein